MNSSILSEKAFKAYVDEINNNNLDCAKEIILSQINDNTLIYRYYRGVNRDLDNLTNNKLWLSKAVLFNDPYDCAFLVNKRSQNKYDVSEYKIAQKEYVEQIESNEKSFQMQSSIFVSCFSELHNSNPMWGYYGSNHYGICVGYALEKLVEKYNCLPVIYSKDIPYVNSDEFCYAGVLYKSDAWSHEREWRIIKYDNKQRSSKGYLIDFETPKRIYLGSKHRFVNEANYNSRKMAQEKGIKYDEEEQYITINDIIYYKNHNSVELYDFQINPKGFEMTERYYKL